MCPVKALLSQAVLLAGTVVVRVPEFDGFLVKVVVFALLDEVSCVLPSGWAYSPL